MHSHEYYAGLDVHKLSISACIKKADGSIVGEEKLAATRGALRAWAARAPRPLVAGLEATLFSHWIYSALVPLVDDVVMGHPARMRAISCGKKKNDRLDASTLADLLRADLFAAITVLPEAYVELRRTLRYRQLLVREMVRMKNKIASLLMECGVEYSRGSLHGRKYFQQLLNENADIAATLKPLLQFSRKQVEELQKMEGKLVEQLARQPEVAARLARLTNIRGVGVMTALTWVLEVGPVERLPSISQAVSYCGLCSAQRSSAGVEKRGPLSKQRNHFLQTALIEAAKLAPRWNPLLAEVYEKESRRGHRNRATLAVARKLVAYLWAADQGHQPAPKPEPAEAFTRHDRSIHPIAAA